MGQPIFQICLLGEFRLNFDGDLLTTIHSARLQSLLAYLLLHRDAQQNRQHLAFLFWPDLSEAQSRNNLRQVIHQLRHALPEADRYLVSDAATLHWREESPFQLDVMDFQDALAAADQAGHSGNISASIAALERAIVIYQGDLLPSCYDDWIIPYRERLHQQCLDALEQITILLEGQRAYATAIPFAQRLLQHDPLHENGYRLLMRLYALNDDRASSLRTYHTCVDILKRELGVEPEPATQEIYQRLLAAQAPLTNLPQNPELVSVSPLVGREAEWRQMQSAWQHAATVRPHFVLLSGEAGIGKSRLGEELVRWVVRQGISTAKSCAYAAEGRLAYGPLVDWLRSEACHASLTRLGSVWLTEISRLLPELLVESPGLPQPEPLVEHWQRQRFFQALARAILGARQPLLLLIDDLQWCDPDTLEFIHYLLRFEPKARVLIVGTMRDEEMIANQPLQTLLLNLRTAAQITEIHLKPLDAAETAKLAAHIVGFELEVDPALQLFRETEGNPLFVVETLRSRILATEGQSSSPQQNLATNSEAPSTTAGLPPRVFAVIAARLSQLSAPARELASLVATIGRAFTFEVLIQASGADEDHLIRRLDELWQRRIVRELGGNTYDFTHDKLREVAYAQVSQPQRRLLHRRVARALESIYAADPDPVSGQLATHFEGAGNPEQAIPYYHRAAVVAQRVGAHDEAIRLLKRALDLLLTFPPTADRDERELDMQTALGALLVHHQGHAASDVLKAYERAQALCQQHGWPLSPPILRALAIANIGRAEYKKALSYGKQLLLLSESQASDFLSTEGHYTLGVAHFWLGAFFPSRQHLEQAIANYKPQQSQHHTFLYTQDPKVICLCRLGFDLWCLGYPVQAVEASQQALDYARELKHAFSLAYALAWHTILQNHLRAFDAGRHYAQELIALSREQNLLYWSLEGISYLGWAQSELGEIEVGIKLLGQGIRDRQSLGYKFLTALYLSLLGEQVGKYANVKQGLMFLDEAQATLEKSEERWCEAELYRRRGALLLLQSDEAGAERAERAQRDFQHAIAVAHSQGARILELRAAVQLARLWLAQGKGDQAERLLAPLYSWFREGFDTPDLRDARELLEKELSFSRGKSLDLLSD